jgi:hydrogenase-4 component F
LSLVVAALSILTVKNYKRMLAYSSIEHAGMIALGFGFGGLGAFAGLLQMMYHSFVKAALFFVAGNLHMKFHSAHIENIKGAARILPITSIMLFIGLFAATGFPPFGIFFSELSILSAGFGQYAAASVVILIAISVAFIGLFRQVTAMVFSKEDAESDVKRGEGNIWLIIPGFVLLALVLVTAFYVPPFVQTLIHEATKQL